MRHIELLSLGIALAFIASSQSFGQIAPPESLDLSNSISSSAIETVEGDKEEFDVESHIVKLNVTKRPPDFYRPWTKASPQKSSGSGVVISGGRILTNAHVVMYESQVLVQLREGGNQLPAKVIAIAPKMDLAIVELLRPEPLAILPGIPIAKELPHTKSRVSVYGYPTGGNDLSVTDGIVSRIEFAQYYYSGAGVRLQVDAALNPGNSGGAAVQNGELAGLVFSKIQEADNIGYLIPPEEIETFLADVDDGSYEGKPFLLDEYQSGENAALRDYLNLPAETTGVVVTRLCPDFDDNPVKPYDVVTHIGPHSVDNQGYVEVRPGLRLRFLYYVPILAEDGKVELTIVRDGKPQQVQVPVATSRELLIPMLSGGYPEYFIYGPLVFTTPSQESVRALGPAWTMALAMRETPLLSRVMDRPDKPGEQLVMVATRMFPHYMTQGYSNQPFSVIQKVNGKPVKSLRHMAELLRGSEEEFLRFEFAGRGETVVFRRQDMEAATEEIMVDEGIRYQASKSLRSVWTED